MSPIRRLPPGVADAIAAGEVVERPASVIKELCENALDAGARRIDVVIEGGGLTRMRVTDDGAGIAAAELELAVARHATSKISRAADLAEIATLGFRGEALASIAAVSDLRITSRTADDGTGCCLHVRAAEVVGVAPAAAGRGTSVEVCDLFFATPARLRFMRPPRTEATHAQRTVSELALAHDGVGFTCRVDGRLVLQTTGTSPGEALRAVFGSAADELVPVAADGLIPVLGAISGPRAHRATRSGIVLVVNRRRVHNRALVVAVEEAYRGLLPHGRHPFGVVGVDIDPTEVDVNVHPTKREVRFRDERAVFAAVQRACWGAIGAARPYGAPTGWDPSHRPEHAGHRGVAPAAVSGGSATSALLLADDGHGQSRSAGGGHVTAIPPLRALGQSGLGWIAAATPGGMVLVDPHAAHEKVLYAALMERLARPADDPATSQLLLMAELIDCDPGHLATLAEHAALVTALGFDLDAFGASTVRCRAVPGGGRVRDPARLVLDLLDGLAEDSPAAERTHRVAALIACHTAVRLGEDLATDEQQRLLDRLAGTPGGLTCPHGRPTIVVLDDAELRRMFRRPAE